MKAWYSGDWRFRIKVLRVGKANMAEECRLGIEPGDTFECTYGMPAGSCPTSFLNLFSVLEVIRGEGDLRTLGAGSPYQTVFLCPEGAVLFQVAGERVAAG